MTQNVQGFVFGNQYGNFIFVWTMKWLTLIIWSFCDCCWFRVVFFVKKNLVGIIMERKSCLQDVIRGHWIKMSSSNFMFVSCRTPNWNGRWADYTSNWATSFPGTSLSSLLGPHWSGTRRSTWGECAVLEDVLEHPWSKTRAESMPKTSSLELLKKICDPWRR
jgi:hypothetical protein